MGKSYAAIRVFAALNGTPEEKKQIEEYLDTGNTKKMNELAKEIFLRHHPNARFI